MMNLLWPSTLNADIGPLGLVGRAIHWLGLGLAAVCGVSGAEFLVDGWATALGVWLSFSAVASLVLARGVRYVLARE